MWDLKLENVVVVHGFIGKSTELAGSCDGGVRAAVTICAWAFNKEARV